MSQYDITEVQRYFDEYVKDNLNEEQKNDADFMERLEITIRRRYAVEAMRTKGFDFANLDADELLAFIKDFNPGYGFDETDPNEPKYITTDIFNKSSELLLSLVTLKARQLQVSSGKEAEKLLPEYVEFLRENQDLITDPRYRSQLDELLEETKSIDTKPAENSGKISKLWDERESQMDFSRSRLKLLDGSNSSEVLFDAIMYAGEIREQEKNDDHANAFMQEFALTMVNNPNFDLRRLDENDLVELENRLLEVDPANSLRESSLQKVRDAQMQLRQNPPTITIENEEDPAAAIPDEPADEQIAIVNDGAEPDPAAAEADPYTPDPLLEDFCEKFEKQLIKRDVPFERETPPKGEIKYDLYPPAGDKTTESANGSLLIHAADRFTLKSKEYAHFAALAASLKQKGFQKIVIGELSPDPEQAKAFKTSMVLAAAAQGMEVANVDLEELRGMDPRIEILIERKKFREEIAALRSGMQENAGPEELNALQEKMVEAAEHFAQKGSVDPENTTDSTERIARLQKIINRPDDESFREYTDKNGQKFTEDSPHQTLRLARQKINREICQKVLDKINPGR